MHLSSIPFEINGSIDGWLALERKRAHLFNRCIKNKMI